MENGNWKKMSSNSFSVFSQFVCRYLFQLFGSYFEYRANESCLSAFAFVNGTSRFLVISFFFLIILFQASVSLKRLRVFLSHDELQEDTVVRKAVASCKSFPFSPFAFWLVQSSCFPRAYFHCCGWVLHFASAAPYSISINDGIFTWSTKESLPLKK